MKRIILSIFIAVAIQSYCSADVNNLPADYQRVLHDKSRFNVIQTVNSLPPVIFVFCADHNGRLAEKGQKWEVTDVITDKSLPTKRLIWAVTDGIFYVVHYERGGYAHSYHVFIAKLNDSDKKPSFVWRGIGGPFIDFTAFIEAVDNNDLDDNLDYAH